MSDKRPCVVVLIGNNDEEVELACACARGLYDVLNHTKMFSRHPLCGDPILLLDKSEEEITEGIREAVQLVKENGASWLVIYYAGHSFWDDLTKEIVIEPKARGRGMCLEEQVKQTVSNEKLEYVKTTIFMDSCLNKSRNKAKDEAKDVGDSKKLRGNTFVLVRSCEFDESVRDGCLFARAIERCARKNLKQRDLQQHVEELAWQLSFGRLCPWSCFEELEEVDDMVLTEEQRELFKNTHFLRFALDLWTEEKLDLDPQRKDKPGPEGSDIDEIVQILKSIVKELETKKAAFEEPWCELEAIAHCTSLETFEEYLKNLETSTPVRDVSSRPTRVLIPENVRGAIVEVLQEKGKKKDFERGDLGNLGYLVQNIGKWYKDFEGTKPRIPPETGTCNFLLDELEGPLQEWPEFTYGLVVEDLDVKNLQESESLRGKEWQDKSIY